MYLLFKPTLNFSQGGVYAILAGLSSAVAFIAFYIALSQRRASLVVPITSLYPVVTIILAMLLLHESINLIHGIGIAFAIAAIILLSL